MIIHSLDLTKLTSFETTVTTFVILRDLAQKFSWGIKQWDIIKL